ncbi:hypothetical protein DD237_002451 [Peronospora effusa]|uniref:Uncharacterized protein n=1 Tax=Peronospora effusa TaxID=542832 RepID=A0A3R8CYJ2_9STRA|nr:hypothetical protein DD237_002451 [Peronospora effusa]
MMPRNLSALVVAMDSIVVKLVCKTKIQLVAIPKSSPLGVEIPSLILSMTPVSASMMAIMHAMTVSRFQSLSKIFLRNRKLMLIKMNVDASCRLCSSSVLLNWLCHVKYLNE